MRVNGVHFGTVVAGKFLPDFYGNSCIRQSGVERVWRREWKVKLDRERPAPFASRSKRPQIFARSIIRLKAIESPLLPEPLLPASLGNTGALPMPRVCFFQP
jgi:hypothetical protein